MLFTLPTLPRHCTSFARAAASSSTSCPATPSGTTWTAYTFDEQITVTLSNGCVLTFFLTQAVTQANQSGVTTRYNIKNCC